MSSLDAGFGKLVVFNTVPFRFDHVSTKDEGSEILVDGFPGRYNGISFYLGGK